MYKASDHWEEIRLFIRLLPVTQLVLRARARSPNFGLKWESDWMFLVQ